MAMRPGGDEHDHKAEILSALKAPIDVQRRLLTFFNAARMPEDLLKSPQRMRGTIGGGHHTNNPHGPHLGHGKSDSPWANAGLSRELAIEIIRQRPPFGWREIGMLHKIHEREMPGFVDKFIPLLERGRFGAWSDPIPLPTGEADAVQNAALLHTGKVIMLTNGTNTVLWDPANGVTILRGADTGLTANLFCSGQSFLSDGKLLVAGGGGGDPGMPSSQYGWKFDPTNERWGRTAGDLAFMRWYPTLVTLGDNPGRVLVAAGWQYYDDADGYVDAPQMEVYSEVTDSFTAVTATGAVGEKIFHQTYPGLHLLPGGQVFYVPTGFGNCQQAPSAPASTEPSGYFVFSGPHAGAWTDTGANVRIKGMSALILKTAPPYVQVLVIGGGEASRAATGQLINLSTVTPSWEDDFPLLEQRVHPNVVLLPDGKVFICGGMKATGTPPTGGRCEIYDPVSGTLTEMADVAYPRHYHSFALLLPTGQVMVAGGASDEGCTVSVDSTIEIFDPPYLWRVRPQITSMPPQAGYGETIIIDTPDSSHVGRVVLVRPMAVTHQTDSEQRVINLDFSRPTASQVSATMPHDRTMAPGGYYMLFLVGNTGGPSVAQFIRLH